MIISLFGTSLFLFFLFLIVLIKFPLLLTKERAMIASTIASVLWGLSIPISALGILIGLMGSGGPNTTISEVLFMFLSLFSLPPLALFALPNIWKQYFGGNYKSVVYFALIPYMSIASICLAYMYILFLHP